MRQVIYLTSLYEGTIVRVLPVLLSAANGEKLQHNCKRQPMGMMCLDTTSYTLFGSHQCRMYQTSLHVAPQDEAHSRTCCV